MKEFRAKKIADKTWLIEQKTVYAQCLIYLIEGSERSLLIDTGFATTFLLKEFIHSLTDRPVEVALTHGHVDHIGNSGLWETVWLHEKDKLTAKDHAEKEFLRNMLRRETSPIVEIFNKTIEKIINVTVPSEYHFFGDNHIFDLGGRIIEAIPTPGHTVGSVCFLDRSQGLIFTGDTCCDQGVLLHLPHAAGLDVYYQSIKNLLELQEKGEFFNNFPGHHGYPADKQCLRKYIECARGVLEGTMKPKLIKNKNIMKAKYEQIIITLPNLSIGQN